MANTQQHSHIRFSKLEAAGKIPLSPSLRRRLSIAIERSEAHFQFHKTYSRQALEHVGQFKSRGRKFLKELEYFRNRQADWTALVYEESTAMAVFFDDISTTGDPESDKLFRSLPGIIATVEGCIDKAGKRLEALRGRHGRGPRGRPDIHLLCREVAAIFQEAGGCATVGKEHSGPFGRFLYQLYEDLPLSVRQVSVTTPSAFAEQALNALNSETPSGVVWARRQARRSQQAKVDARRRPLRHAPLGGPSERAGVKRHRKS